MTDLRTPSVDLAELADQLGHVMGAVRGESLAQYLAWCERSGLLEALKIREGAPLPVLFQHTVLTEDAADGLLRILLCLKLVRYTQEPSLQDKGYALTELAKEYLDKESPYYVGPALYTGQDKAIPALFLREPESGIESVPPVAPPLDRRSRLRMQHGRNFAPAVVAARGSGLGSVRHLVDIGGGTGVFAIPLALDNPGMRITLVDWPDALDGIRQTLASYGVEQRIELVGMDFLTEDWHFPTFDGILFANIFHGLDDASCRHLAHKSFEALSPHGTVWLHEVLFNESRDGPLLAALWNANMLAFRSGARQRTRSELAAMLLEAGFESCSAQPTAARFSLLRATKPGPA